MRSFNSCALFVFVVMSVGTVISPPVGAENLFPTFAGSHTVGLWLFDEVNYPHTTLIDASMYEYDLRLMDGGRLDAGKFGNALRVSSGHAICYAGFVGSFPSNCMRRGDGNPSGFWGPTTAPKELATTLADRDWTVEFWLKLSSDPGGGVVVIDLGDNHDPGFTLSLSSAGFEIQDAYAGLKALCPTGVSSGAWRHIAFTRSGSTVRYFVDGQQQSGVNVSSISRQPLPLFQEPSSLADDCRGFNDITSPEWAREHRFNLAVGSDRRGGSVMNGAMIDELRVSDVLIYTSDFSVPGSFARKYDAYGAAVFRPTVPNGAPLRFADGAPSTVPLGQDKYIFIDDAIVDKGQSSGYRMQMNKPGNRQDINFTPESNDWRASVFDGGDGKVYMFIPDSYGSDSGIIRLRTSEDGVNFTSPNWGIHGNNDYIFKGMPAYGSAFVDLNPNVLPEERFKYSGWIANRGIVMFLSPDGIHWRRNETLMLPLVSGGGAETYWDDQRGVYVDFIKRDSSFKTGSCSGGGRRAIMFEAKEGLNAWPFNALASPYYENWPFPAVTCEGPVIMGPNDNGQVYRTRAMKYPWAADAYVAFVWRFQGDQSRQIDLGISRNGVDWRFFAGEQWYISSDGADEVLSLYGIIKREDQIWHYVDYGGAHGGGGGRVYSRLIQRLDGFVSLDADATATVITRPLTFDGQMLNLNIRSNGQSRVAFLDQNGQELPGFGLGDCDPIITDSIVHTVAWRGNASIRRHAGKVVRVKFELENAKLYAFQFSGLSRMAADLNSDGVVNFLDFASVVEGDGF